MPEPSLEPLLTYRETAEFLNCSIETVRRRVKAGDIPAYRYGPRTLRIKKADILALGRPLLTGGASRV